MDKKSYKHTYNFLKIHHLVYHDILWYLRCCSCKGVENTGLREKLHSVNSQQEQTAAQVTTHLFIQTSWYKINSKSHLKQYFTSCKHFKVYGPKKYYYIFLRFQNFLYNNSKLCNCLHNIYMYIHTHTHTHIYSINSYKYEY
jgi:hypothetical protein